MEKIIIKETIAGGYFFHVFYREDDFRDWLIGHFSIVDNSCTISRVDCLPCGELKWQEWDDGCYNVYKDEFGHFWWEGEDNASVAV